MISAMYKSKIIKVSILKYHTCFFFDLNNRPKPVCDGVSSLKYGRKTAAPNTINVMHEGNNCRLL